MADADVVWWTAVDLNLRGGWRGCDFIEPRIQHAKALDARAGGRTGASDIATSRSLAERAQLFELFERHPATEDGLLRRPRGVASLAARHVQDRFDQSCGGMGAEVGTVSTDGMAVSLEAIQRQHAEGLARAYAVPRLGMRAPTDLGHFSNIAPRALRPIENVARDARVFVLALHPNSPAVAGGIALAPQPEPLRFPLAGNDPTALHELSRRHETVGQHRDVGQGASVRKR